MMVRTELEQIAVAIGNVADSISIPGYHIVDLQKVLSILTAHCFDGRAEIIPPTEPTATFAIKVGPKNW